MKSLKYALIGLVSLMTFQCIYAGSKITPPIRARDVIIIKGSTLVNTGDTRETEDHMTYTLYKINPNGSRQLMDAISIRVETRRIGGALEVLAGGPNAHVAIISADEWGAEYEIYLYMDIESRPSGDWGNYEIEFVSQEYKNHEISVSSTSIDAHRQEKGMWATPGTNTRLNIYAS